MNDGEKITNEDEMPQKLRSYPAKMKVEAVKYAEINGNKAAGRKYAVDEKRIREQQKSKNKITNLMSKKKRQLRKRLDGAKTKPLPENLEKNVRIGLITKFASLIIHVLRVQDKQKYELAKIIAMDETLE